MTDPVDKIKDYFGLDEIYCIDLETYWANDYTLSSLATTEYIMDERFELQLASVLESGEERPMVFTGPEFMEWKDSVDWSRVGIVNQHQQFDGLIESHHCGIIPKMYFDTKSMANACMPQQAGRSLDSLSKAFGGKGKVRRQALVKTKGKRLLDFSAEELNDLMDYAGDDTVDTWMIFRKMLPYFPMEELRLIDLTMKMYCRPRVLLDEERLVALEQSIEARKAELLSILGVSRTQIMSNDQFAELLTDLGVDPPTKISARTGKETWAFSKQDLEFKELLEHDDPAVVALVESRLEIKSTSVETRARRMAKRAKIGPQPIYYNYWGAGTGRWSGGDKSNWQNLKRGSDLRTAVYAPPGYGLLIADLSQIEARINAWFAGENKKLDVFREYDIILGYDEKGKPIRQGPDVYRVAASGIYHIPIDQVTDPLRFVGKVAELGLGFGAGWRTFANMLRLGAMGPPMNISDEDAEAAVAGWRSVNPFIVANWKATDNYMRSAFFGCQTLKHGCVSYEGRRNPNTGMLNGYMHLPGGMAIRYDDVQATEDGYGYLKKRRYLKDGTVRDLRGKLYGGLGVENRTQALARRVISEHALAIDDELPHSELVLTTHDELVIMVPLENIERDLEAVKSIMSQTPTWAKGLPIAVDAHWSTRYDK